MGGVEKVSQDNYPHLVIRSRKHSKRKKKSNWGCFSYIYEGVNFHHIIQCKNLGFGGQDPWSADGMTGKKANPRAGVAVHTIKHPQSSSGSTRSSCRGLFALSQKLLPLGCKNQETRAGPPGREVTAETRCVTDQRTQKSRDKSRAAEPPGREVTAERSPFVTDQV